MMKIFSWLGEFVTDSTTGKASGTALMKLGTMVVLWWAFIRVSFYHHSLPNIPIEIVVIILAILFEKRSGMLLDSYINNKITRNGIPSDKVSV